MGSLEAKVFKKKEKSNPWKCPKGSLKDRFLFVDVFSSYTNPYWPTGPSPKNFENIKLVRHRESTENGKLAQSSLLSQTVEICIFGITKMYLCLHICSHFFWTQMFSLY